MKYIDVGVNLLSNKFSGNIEEILEDSFCNDIEAMILTGTSVNNSKAAMNLVNTFHSYSLYYTVGIHPESANVNLNKNYLGQLRKLIGQKCVAIGETGLDYSKSYCNKKKQLEVFEEHIKLSIEFNKPLFLHERNASDDFVMMLNKYKGFIKGVVHCYTDNRETAEKINDLGLYFGITGWICDCARNSNLLEAIKIIPIDKLLVETDSPFLHPHHSLHVNTPKNIKLIVSEIAKILNKNEENLAEILLENTKKFFNI